MKEIDVFFFLVEFSYHIQDDSPGVVPCLYNMIIYFIRILALGIFKFIRRSIKN